MFPIGTSTQLTSIIPCCCWSSSAPRFSARNASTCTHQIKLIRLSFHSHLLFLLLQMVDQLAGGACGHHCSNGVLVHSHNGPEWCGLSCCSSFQKSRRFGALRLYWVRGNGASLLTQKGNTFSRRWLIVVIIAAKILSSASGFYYTTLTVTT